MSRVSPGINGAGQRGKGMITQGSTGSRWRCEFHHRVEDDINDGMSLSFTTTRRYCFPQESQLTRPPERHPVWRW